MHSNARRTNGFDRPLRCEQFFVLVVYICVVTGYFLLVDSFIFSKARVALTIVNVVLTIVVLVCWYAAASIDPGSDETDAAFVYYCTRRPIPPKKFCKLCLKDVHGMDHHCVWLNNCVGAKNYQPFFLLTWSGTVQMLLHTVIGVFLTQELAAEQPVIDRILATSSPSSNGPQTTYFALVGLFTAASGILAMWGFCLACFHTYLVLVQRTTYDYVLAWRRRHPPRTAGGRRNVDFMLSNISASRDPEESVNSVMLENTRLEREMSTKREQWQQYLDNRASSRQAGEGQFNSRRLSPGAAVAATDGNSSIKGQYQQVPQPGGGAADETKSNAESPHGDVLLTRVDSKSQLKPTPTSGRNHSTNGSTSHRVVIPVKSGGDVVFTVFSSSAAPEEPVQQQQPPLTDEVLRSVQLSQQEHMGSMFIDGTENC